MGRLISAGALAYDQLDFFFPDGSASRVPDIQASGLQMWLFVNNGVLSWPLVDGTSVPDSSVSSGHVYFNQIAASPGFYSLRFFPDRVGFFRMVFLHPSYGIEVERNYDVLPSGVLRPSNGGLIASTASPSSRC